MPDLKKGPKPGFGCPLLAFAVVAFAVVAVAALVLA